MFSSNATIAEAEFLIIYYNDLRFQGNHSLTFFDKIVDINFRISLIISSPAKILPINS